MQRHLGLLGTVALSVVAAYRRATGVSLVEAKRAVEGWPGARAVLVRGAAGAVAGIRPSRFVSGAPNRTG